MWIDQHLFDILTAKTVSQGTQMAFRAKEDYLKAIYELEEKDGIAKIVSL